MQALSAIRPYLVIAAGIALWAGIAVMAVWQNINTRGFLTVLDWGK
jgi:hypothetical protein